MITNLLSYLQYRQSDTLTKSYVAQSRVDTISCSQCLKRELDLQIALSKLYQQSQCKPLWQRIRDRYRQWTEGLYRVSGIAAWDRWILEKLLSGELRQFILNSALGVVLLGYLTELSADTVYDTLQEITKIATPHMGVTTFEQLNRTAMVCRLIRAGLEK